MSVTEVTATVVTPVATPASRHIIGHVGVRVKEEDKAGSRAGH